MTDDLTARVDADAAGTVLRLRGSLDAARCGTLQELLDMAFALRRRGRVVVDLAGVDQLGPTALAVLRNAADQASRTGRSLAIRSLRTDQLVDPRGVQLLRALWPGVADPPSPPCRPSRRSRRRPALADGAGRRR